MVAAIGKFGAELIEQGVRTGLKQLGRKGSKQVLKQSIKQVPTPKISTPDWMQTLKFPKKTSEISIKDIEAHDAVTNGEGRAALESILEGTRSKDKQTRLDAFDSLSEYSHGLRGAYHIEDGANAQIDAAAKAVGVRSDTGVKADVEWQHTANRATGETPARANKHNTPEQIAAGEQVYKRTAKVPNQAPHHGLSFADGAKINNNSQSAAILRYADERTEVPGPIGHTIENLMGVFHKFNSKARADKIGSILQQKPEWTDPVIRWNDPLLGEVEVPRKRLLSDLVKDTTDTNMPSSRDRFDWNSIGIPNGKIGEARWPPNPIDLEDNPKALGSLVTDAQRQAAWVNRYRYHNINVKDFRIDPAGDIKGFDHVDVGHVISEGSPEYQALREMIDDPNVYVTYSVEEAGQIIANWRNLQRRVFININQLRLDFVLEELGLKIRTNPKSKTGMPKFKWNKAEAKKLGYVNEQNPGLVTERVQTFMNENPARAAIVGYRDFGMRNDKVLLEMLSQKPKEVTPMLQSIFSVAEQNVASMDVPATVEAAEQLAQMYPGN
jgi:hypothetical protein